MLTLCRNWSRAWRTAQRKPERPYTVVFSSFNYVVLLNDSRNWIVLLQGAAGQPSSHGGRVGVRSAVLLRSKTSNSKKYGQTISKLGCGNLCKESFRQIQEAFNLIGDGWGRAWCQIMPSFCARPTQLEWNIQCLLLCARHTLSACVIIVHLPCPALPSNWNELFSLFLISGSHSLGQGKQSIYSPTLAWSLFLLRGPARRIWQ